MTYTEVKSNKKNLYRKLLTPMRKIVRIWSTPRGKITLKIVPVISPVFGKSESSKRQFKIWLTFSPMRFMKNTH
jgi:hypothetical protein